MKKVIAGAILGAVTIGGVGLLIVGLWREAGVVGFAAFAFLLLATSAILWALGVFLN